LKREVDVFLNSVALRDVDPKIIAIYAEDSAPEDELTESSVARLPGRNIAFKKRPSLNVTISFKVRELYNLNTRMDVINAVNRWAAKGGSLALSYRPGQTLNVALIQPATPGNIRDYNAEFKLVFTSDGCPYFTDASAPNRQIAGSSVSTTFVLTGTAPSPVDAAIYFIKAATYLNITVGHTSIRLSGLSLPAGAYVTITHDDTGVADIMYGSVSLFPFLTDDSGDCLLTEGSVTDLSFDTDGDVEITFKSFGRYL
jgi:hypothetical protein